MPKTERILKVMQRVYEKQSFTVSQMAEEFGVSCRTMLRYLHELSELGVPLYANEGRHGGYSILNTRQRSLPEPAETGLQRLVKPGFHLVGMEIKVPFTAYYMTQALKPKLWTELSSRIQEIRYPRSTRGQDWIAAVLSRGPVYHYIAGIEVTAIGTIPPGMTSLTLPTREYIVYVHEGGTGREDTDQSFIYVMQQMKQRGLHYNPEMYGLERRSRLGDDRVQIYIPVAHSVNPGALHE
ncbi:HTH domain-containing protein [Paenibacillus cisolokensis]|uniref:HTH domain-containing protein n=1 Tax=Paenibacillus cisolokensis TaxID=1658519 RepID=UPI003D2BCE4B